jgi:Leucine-rich repeat (LRR) protein
MKKNDWLLLISVLLYSYLFYEQSAGINFLLFNIALIIGLLIKNPASLKEKSWLAAAAGSIISSACIMYYSSPLAIVANIFSLGLLSVFSFSPKTSIFTSLFMTFCSSGSSVVFMFIDWGKRRKKSKVGEKNERPAYVTVLMLLFVVVIAILFFVMYQSSNPLFKEFTKNINLDFISFPWIFFTLGGLLLMYGFYYNRHIQYLTTHDANFSNNLTEDKANADGFLNKLFKMDTEHLTGVILLVVLNLMLLLLNSLDVGYLWVDGKLPEGMKHKEFVHDGVGSLIASLIFAIIIMLYYFRGRLNYHSKNKTLKLLAYVWIVQNIFMIISTAYRNNMYIEESGISYKKIGLYVYLMLCLIGLVTTYIKISRNKSNMYLIRVNPWCYYAILIVSCLINWDVIITGFNLNKAFKENKKLEKYYLADLSFKNLPQLLVLPDSVKGYDDYEARDYYFALRGTYFSSFKVALDKKLFSFMTDMQDPDWQSWCAEKSRVYDEVLALNEQKQIKAVDLSSVGYFKSLGPIKPMDNIESINLDNNNFTKLDELAGFPHLKSLSIRSNQLDSLDKLPLLNELEEFKAGENPFTSGLSKLKNIPNVKTLELPGIGISDLNVFSELKKLEILDVSRNSISDFSLLNKLKNLKSLNANNTFRGKLDSFPALSSLTNLDIGQNEITASNSALIFNQLKNCVNISTLSVSNNTLSNLYSLISDGGSSIIFPNLEVLYATNNNIYAIAGVGVYQKLKELYLANNQVKDIAPVFRLTNLEALSIEYNAIQKIEGIEQLKKLRYLNLSGCGIRTGFNSLADLTKLTDLNVAGNNISNIKPFTSIKTLRYLNLTDNKVKDLNGIENLESLEELYITQNRLTDITPLMKLKKLKILYMDNIKAEDLKKLRNALPDCRINDSYYKNDKFNNSESAI